MVSSKAVKNQNSVDLVMQNIALTLIGDFRKNSNDPLAFRDFESAIKTRDPKEIRAMTPAFEMHEDPIYFKMAYQLHSIFKRHRFKNDLYSDEELQQKAISGFTETQSRIRSVDLDSLGSNAQRVLDKARIYIADLLGEYNDEEHRSLCRFGKKASVGVSARMACEAQRWEIPLTGSKKQISWFDAEMHQVECVQNYWAAQLHDDPSGSIYREVDSLKLALVPKTFKSLRSIMPNTTIGSYMSYGLGEMIRLRLKRKGFNIKTLQKRHRVLARKASICTTYATADLSSASDSISVALVERLFPPDWYAILCQSRISEVELPDGSCVSSYTFSTMGIGYTFPLQTLVFLALLKAIEATLYSRRNRRTISVYGDDLIYSSRMHKYVVLYFEQYGFVINKDKTFHEGHFRESCGGDYYHGMDVRPFQPRNEQVNVGKLAYQAVLYKLVNGLLTRWSEYEIEMTLSYLAREIEIVAGAIKLVPGNFPDDSGVQCHYLGCWSFLQHVRTAHPKAIGHGVYRFSYLRFKPETREEKRHEPYLWNALRGIADQPIEYGGSATLQDSIGVLVQRINKLVGTDREDQHTFLEQADPIVTVRSCLTGRRLPRLSTFVTVSHTGRYTRQYGTSCFEDRR